MNASEKEIERLANYLLQFHEDEIGKGGNESAVDVAIRLLDEKIKSEYELKVGNKQRKIVMDIQANEADIEKKKGEYGYMNGMYNGMELMIASYENREPIYKKKWGNDDENE